MATSSSEAQHLTPLEESLQAAAKDFAMNWTNMNENFMDQLWSCCAPRGKGSLFGGWNPFVVETQSEEYLKDERSERGTEIDDTDNDSSSDGASSLKELVLELASSITTDAIEDALLPTSGEVAAKLVAEAIEDAFAPTAEELAEAAQRKAFAAALVADAIEDAMLPTPHEAAAALAAEAIGAALLPLAAGQQPG